jgi:septal ring factor EnvC (AmiA/AmiB activator)
LGPLAGSDRAVLIRSALLVCASLACAPVGACPQAELAKASPSPRAAQPSAELQFDWPAQGTIVIECWTEDKEKISIAVGEGAIVRAAQSGSIVYAGELKGYGTLVTIRHTNGFVSATYGDLDGLRAKAGDHIARGQPIAVIRLSSGSDGARLGFALRQGGETVDARPYMTMPEPERELGADSLLAEQAVSGFPSP